MSLTDLQRDILIKSAEGIQEGAWCVGARFEGYGGSLPLLVGSLSAEQALATERCALGELELRTFLAGGTVWDLQAVVKAAGRVVLTQCDEHQVGAITEYHGDEREQTAIFGHNDYCFQDQDAFTAGQEWARIFREVAEE